MRLTASVVGVLLMLAGTVFALQGVNVLPGSFMTGRPEWAVIGTVAVVVGVVMLLAAWRRPKG